MGATAHLVFDKSIRCARNGLTRKGDSLFLVAMSDTKQSGDKQLEAYHLHLPAMRALAPDKIREQNADVFAAGLTVLGVVEKIRPFMAQLKTFPLTPAWAVDELETRAQALLHVHSLLTTSTTPLSGFPEKIERGAVLHKELLAGANFLALSNTFEPRVVKEIPLYTSHRSLALGLRSLANLYREKPADAARLGLSEKVEEAAILGGTLMNMLGERELSEEKAAEINVLRARAFTLVLGAHEEIQRGMGYLRFHEGDADSFAPSLFAARKGTEPRKGDKASREGAAAGGKSGSAGPAPLADHGKSAEGATPHAANPDDNDPSFTK
jgi:hypothetical protein